jgi:lipoate synthase
MNQLIVQTDIKSKRSYTLHGKSRTIEYRRNTDYLRRYNATYDEIKELYIKQSGLCKICEDHIYLEGDCPKNRRLHVDHDHRTGKIRGLLCGFCNVALGRFESLNAERFNNLIEYLKGR